MEIKFDSIVVSEEDRQYIELHTEIVDHILSFYGIPIYVTEYLPKGKVVAFKDGKIVGMIDNLEV